MSAFYNIACYTHIALYTEDHCDTEFEKHSIFFQYVILCGK